jgi:CYTH domain-containing protein
MKMEIERKFLVAGDGWRDVAGDGDPYEQGYIFSGPDQVTVRVRRAGDRGFLTLKGASEGISRPELEYEIPVDDAEYMLKNFCGSRVVSKKRYHASINGSHWEIDEFSGKNKGLVLAEIELESEGQAFEKPDWIDEEVSCDPRYFNATLAATPFSTIR